MKCKTLTPALFVVTLVLLGDTGARAGAGAQRNGRIKFLRPLQRHWTQSAGRSESASTGRGLMKHFMMFKNMWQQPSSNVIIITRPTTTQNDDTTTTTNAPTGTATRALPRIAEKENASNNDEDLVHDDVDDDNDVIAALGTNTKNSLTGVNDKISLENLQGSDVTQRKRNNKRRKKHRNAANRNSKRRKQIIDIDNILKREEDRRNGLEGRRSASRRTTVKPAESSNDSGSFMRLMSSFRLQPSAVY